MALGVSVSSSSYFSLTVLASRGSQGLRGQVAEGSKVRAEWKEGTQQVLVFIQSLFSNCVSLRTSLCKNLCWFRLLNSCTSVNNFNTSGERLVLLV